MHNIQSEEKKTALSALVGRAVDELNIRDYYKWADNLKIAKHVKALMDILLINHNKNTEQQLTNQKDNLNETNELRQTGTSLQKFTENTGPVQFYRQLPKIMRNSPEISPHDRLLCQTVMDLMIELNFQIENDINLQADEITETITTTRVPDRSQLRHYIDKKDSSVWSSNPRIDWYGLGLEELYKSELDKVPGDFNIDPQFKKIKLYRLVREKINPLSHTPFEYFHEFETVQWLENPVYLLRIYTDIDKSTDKKSSIVTFLNKEFKFLCPDFPAIDDSQSDNFFMNNAFNDYNIWRCGAGLFFRYKDQLFLIKNGKYKRPLFAEQIINEKFYYIKKFKEKKWYYEIYTDKNEYLTDSYFRVLWDSIDEINSKLNRTK